MGSKRISYQSAMSAIPEDNEMGNTFSPDKLSMPGPNEFWVSG
jgi:hypothetical protein